MNAPHETLVEVRAQLPWNFYRDEESQRWIAICEAIKVTVEAESHTELRENIQSGLNMLFRNLLRDHELERFLQLRGWSLGSPLPNSADDVQFDVPIELIACKKNNDGIARSVR